MIHHAYRFAVVCRRRDSGDTWEILSRHELREQALSVADIHASTHMDQEAGIFELTTVMRASIRTDVENFR